MRTTTSNYDTEAAKSVKAPVWVVKIDGISTYFSTGTFSGITSDYKKLLSGVRYIGPQINVQIALSDFGDASFGVIDKDNTFTNIIKNNPKLNNTQVRFFYGYSGLAITDFSEFPAFYIYSLKLNADLLTYTVECRSVLYRLFDKTLFSGLANDKISMEPIADPGDPDYPEKERIVKTGDTTIYVDDESEFNAVDTWDGINDYILIGGKEICQYSAKTAVGAGLDTFTVVRNILSTTGAASTFRSGDEVQQVVRVVPYATDDSRCSGKYENPFWALLWLLTTTGAGTNGNFDQGVAGVGLGIDSDLIEVDNIHRAGLEHFVCWTNATNNFMNRTGFWFEEVTDPLEWIQEYFLKPVRGFLFLSGDGKIDVKILDSIPDNAAGTLSDANITKISDVGLRFDLAINQAVVKEYNPITGGQLKVAGVVAEVERKCTESVAAVGASETLEINDCFTYRHRTTNAVQNLRKLFGTFANPPLELTVTVLDSKNTFLPGDIVTLSSNYFPDWVNEGRGVTGLKCLVLEQEFNTFECSYKLLAFDALNAVDLYTVNKVTSVTREAMSYEVDTTSTYAGMSANDAYDSNASAYDADILRIRLEIAPPAAPDNPDEWRYIDVKIQTYVSSVNQFGRDVRIHYNTGGTSVFDVWLYVYYSTPAPPQTFNRVRCDWYATDATTVNDRPSYVKLKEVWYIEENYTVETI